MTTPAMAISKASFDLSGILIVVVIFTVIASIAMLFRKETRIAGIFGFIMAGLAPYMLVIIKGGDKSNIKTNIAGFDLLFILEYSKYLTVTMCVCLAFLLFVVLPILGAKEKKDKGSGFGTGLLLGWLFFSGGSE
ncbi:hypothetical protein [Campylobacter sp. CCUG 57310]|uniref:hypothetical protein n=1 Tax=Campylobacter sp. CCUG 57310 TaxID=2517362 RepID=UPI0015637C84|nr:hypothetical protein [Campylobacter sp. CCUG 57310]QKF93205.1 hypothetical protein CORI_a019 [Campylobacter sp. CCUG 57310]